MFTWLKCLTNGHRWVDSRSRDKQVVCLRCGARKERGKH